MSSFAQEYLNTVISRVKYYKHLAEKTFEQIEEKDFYLTASSSSNSIATIIQHMSGNMLSRWTNFLTEDGEKEWRSRDSEFENQQLSHSQLIGIWEKGWSCFIETIQSLEEDDLQKTVYIRGEPLSVVDAINRQLAHYPYHIGQIIFIGKIIRDENWSSLSIPKGQSDAYNQSDGIKDPAKKY